MSILQRYAQALRLSAPKIVAETPGTSVEGYWLDTLRYFFLAERFEPSIGRLVSIPSIADCDERNVTEVIPLAELARLLSGCSSPAVDLDALAAARFEMPDEDTLAVSAQDQDYWVDIRRRVVRSSRAAEIAPALFSPDGHYACFVRGDDLWIKEIATGAQRPLTTDGEPHRAYGRKSESGLSAISYRKRPMPMALWSPDSQWVFTHRIDERAVPEAALVQHAPPEGGRPRLHRYRFAMPGDPLPIATYLAIHVASGRIVRFDDFSAPAVMGFLPIGRSAWFSGPEKAWFLRFDRYFRQVDLLQLDLASGRGRVAYSETTPSGYLDLHALLIGAPNVRTLANSDEVIWYSERDGWGHLYLVDAAAGAVRNRITRGDWMVRDIVHVDEERRTLLFLAGGLNPDSDPARRSLCTVSLDGSGFRVLLGHDGDIHVSGVSQDARYGVIQYLSVERGNHTHVVDLRSREGFLIAASCPAPGERTPRHFTALAADGSTRLHGVMFFPSYFDEGQRYPLIDCIYPGPHSSQQPQSYCAMNSARARSLAELGFITIMLDQRGAPVASRAFHQAGYGSLLEPQLADHAAVVRQLSERHEFIDGNRAGIIGDSAGGAATARALFDYGDVFKAGVSVCGPHDPRLYTSMWSDKYAGPIHGDTPVEPPNTALAHKLQGKLLLISGDMDENVHVAHTFALADALIRANKDFELLIVPNEGHNVLFTSGYAQRRAWDFFVRCLRDETPPSDFELRFEPDELARAAARVMREFR